MTADKESNRLPIMGGDRHSVDLGCFCPKLKTSLKEVINLSSEGMKITQIQKWVTQRNAENLHTETVERLGNYSSSGKTFQIWTNAYTAAQDSAVSLWKSGKNNWKTANVMTKLTRIKYSKTPSPTQIKPAHHNTFKRDEPPFR